MPIYLGERKKTLFKGDYHPAEFYKGNQKITGYNVAKKTDTELSLDNTYNDVLLPVIEGKSYQAVTETSPTPDNPSPIIVSGGSDVVLECRNLFDKTFENSYHFKGGVSSGFYITSQDSATKGFLINTEKNKQITISSNFSYVRDNSFRIAEFNHFPVENTVSDFSYYVQCPTGLYTFTAKLDTKYVAVIFLLPETMPDETKKTTQILLGTTPYSYTPYQPTITLHLPEGFGGVGEVGDRIYSENGKVWWEKKTESVVFNGSDDESWKQTSVNTNTITYVFTVANGMTTANCPAICNRTTYGYGDVERLSYGYKNIYFWINKSRLTTQDVGGFKAWLQSNPLTVRYQLGTPQLIDITDTPTGQAYKQLQTYYPYTHIYSDAQEELKPIISANIKQF